MIGVIDCSIGNIHSVAKALRSVGMPVLMVRQERDLRECDGLILPGVGAFGDGIRRLNERGLVEGIRRYAESGLPLLGICLGMQLLFDTSEELGHYEGLGILRGRVVRLQESPDYPAKLRVPHVGWQPLLMPQPEVSWADTLLKGLVQGDEVYFCHSFVALPDDPECILAQIEYGQRILAYVQNGNVYGCQFHPEKSRHVGLSILRRFGSLV